MCLNKLFPTPQVVEIDDDDMIYDIIATHANLICTFLQYVVVFLDLFTRYT